MQLIRGDENPFRYSQENYCHQKHRYLGQVPRGANNEVADNPCNIENPGHPPLLGLGLGLCAIRVSSDLSIQ